MLRNLLLPALAIAALAFAGTHIANSRAEPPRAEPLRPPPATSFATTVAGGGVVEAATENIALGTALGGVVEEVLAQPGDVVRAGQPLLRIDSRHLRAELAVREQAVAAAQAQLAKQKESPRPETLPPARARRDEAQANLAGADDAVARTEGLRKQGVANEEDFIRAREAAAAAKARLATAQAELALLEAGAWRTDLAIAAAQVAEAEARRGQTRVELERCTVLAPTVKDAAGKTLPLRVWQVNVRPGEHIDAQSGKALMALGGAGPLHVRVDIDEHDIPRFQPGSPATAQIRGSARAKLPLEFHRIEPQVVPKRSLTGEAAERVDTRVLQALFALPADAPVFIGQQVDVYIDAAPRSAGE